ncbi:TTC5 protein [Loa loa]|uniref:TTC5 protein n=1 Tax=Loa loa TaxID=7209 RepID=A0A1I7VSS9_LOALO|nr:TTC5 protein [Loa loa]EFO26739.1 TTC5 protein [Loa loa]
MDVLEEKIKEAECFRDGFYQHFPKSTLEEKKQAVREKVLPLIQDIPLDMNAHSSTSARYNYICGRILNICLDYDANCERHLSRAVKLDPSLSDAWYELGECVRKKEDFTTAVDCFRKSAALKRSGKCLASLAIALRQIALSTTEAKIQQSLQEEAAQLSGEAVELDPYSEKAWHTLGNSCLMQFFFKYQADMELMNKAREAYETALQLGDVRYSPDLHLNYSTALKFVQNYGECLKHLKIATIYDPGFLEAKERQEILLSFLKQVNGHVQKKGKLTTKKMRHFKSSISDEDFGVYCKKPFKKESGKIEILRTVLFRELNEGINGDVVICGKVIAIILNTEVIPYTFVGCDKEGSCCAFSVYNASDKFGLIIGDSIAVPEPHIIDVKITSEESGCENFDFRIVRIVNPLKMLRNGKPVKMDCVAFCKVVADFVY